MKTSEALYQLTGRHSNIGSGPLSHVADVLLQKFRSEESDRMARAAQMAHQRETGPFLAAMQQEIIAQRSAELCDQAVPCVTRYDAYQMFHEASRGNPADFGLRQARAHAQHAWQSDPRGYLTVGELATLREHLKRQYPRSAAVSVLEQQIPRLSLANQDVRKFAQLASQIRGANQAEREQSYAQVVAANGLNTDSLPHMRARALIRGLADMAEHDTAQRSAGAPSDPGGQNAAARTLDRMAQQDGHYDPSMGGEDVLEVEQDAPYDESEQASVELESPISGEPLTVEIGEAVSADPAVPVESDEYVDGAYVASLHYFGQLDDYDTEDPLLETDDAVDGFDTAPAASSATITDPTSGQEMSLTLEAVPGADSAEMGATFDNGGTMEGMDNAAARRAATAGARSYVVHAVSGGYVCTRPIEAARLSGGMPQMLKRIARNMIQSSGVQPGYAVVADPRGFSARAFVLLDPAAGNYLRVTAVTEGMEPSMINGQPQVQHNLSINEEDGAAVLTSDAPLSQSAPSAASDSTTPTAKASQKLSNEDVQRICAARGLTAASIEEKLLKTGCIRVQGQGKSASLEVTDQGDVAFLIGERGRRASMLHLEAVIGDFQAYAATLAKPATRTAAAKTASFTVRALFSVGCRKCGMEGEYLMPDKPENIRCASCGDITPAGAVGIQLEARGEQAFPGYVIRSAIPGADSDRKYNGRRILQAIRQIAPGAQAAIRQGQLEVTVRQVDDGAMNRIRRVLADKFGVRDLVAQMAPLDPMGQPIQHATVGPPPTMTQPVDPNAQGADPGQPASSGQGVQNLGSTAAAVIAPGSTREGLPKGALFKHVQIKYPDGVIQWQPVEAANERIARTIVASYMDGSEVLQIVDSTVPLAGQTPPTAAPRTAQIEPPAEMGGEILMPGEAGGAPGGVPGPGGELGLSPDLMMGGGEQIENASIDEQTEEAMRSAFQHYRNTGKGIAAAIDDFAGTYGHMLQQYGDETSPQRHLAEAAVIRVAKEVYEQPALLNPVASKALTSEEQAQLARRAAYHREVAMHLHAARGDIPTPKKTNTQQEDWVSLGGGSDVLGKDSETGRSQNNWLEPKGKPSATHSMQDNAGTSQSSGELGADTQGKDPGRFKAPKPPADGHVHTPSGSGWGTSYADTNLGKDSDTGEGGASKEWDSAASGASSGIRSK